ncbi:UDP-glucose 4-epimerase GalE [bacterium]|nr:UDP-glucose 4-epimerase GalE [bacterium]
MRSKVLVLGGAGYIGSHVCKALHMEGFLPVVVDDLSTGHREFVQWGDFIECSLLDKQALIQVFEKVQPDVVMHFAARIEVGESVLDPLNYYQNNVAGTLNVLDAMKQIGCSRLVFSSTAAVYGNPERALIDELHSCKPINPYGRSKYMMEQVLADSFEAYGIQSVVFRYFNACGADPDGLIGEDHAPETHLIPNIYMAATGKRDFLTIFGNDYDTQDGTCIRDYIHVSDLADAHVRGCRYMLDHEGYYVFNLGTSEGISVNTLFKEAERVIGKSIPVVMGERRLGDASVLVADASLAMQTLGWKPKYSDLDTILDTSWRWYTRRF